MPLSPGNLRAALTASSALALAPVTMQPACAPLSRMIRVSWRVSISAIATVLPRRRNCSRPPSARQLLTIERQVANDEPGRVDLRGLEVVGVRADVADVRIRQRDDLAVVRRVGQDLLIARHRGVEHHLAERSAFGADRTPLNTVPSSSASIAGSATLSSYKNSACDERRGMGCKPGSRSRVDQRGNSGGNCSSSFRERSTVCAPLTERVDSLLQSRDSPSTSAIEYKPGRLAGGPARGAQRAARERLAIGGAMRELDLFLARR